MQERKRLHNQLLELRGNIRVFCRVRPLNSREKESCVTFPEEANICIEQGRGKDAKVFQFDHVFGPQSTQSEVFEETQPLITSMLDGYNVCIFAYGQTGTGKTHTMEGYGDQPGVNTRALQALFDLAKERKKLFTYDIKVSILEIYNETLVDLLVGRNGAKLEVKPHPEGGTHVPELTVVPVTCMQDVQRLMEKGKANRSVGATCMNEHSSRSHCILSVYTESRAVATGARAQGKLHLIDLAGSERVGRSGATGDRLKEAQNINQSLSALGDVVAALIAKQKHVPFRNSKLTFFLQDSLGGDSKALMFVQGAAHDRPPAPSPFPSHTPLPSIDFTPSQPVLTFFSAASPSVDDAGETLCSLTFAARVRNIELGPAKKRADTTGALALKAVEGECEKLKGIAAAFEQRATAAEAEVAELRSGLQGSRAQQEEEVFAPSSQHFHPSIHLLNLVSDARASTSTGAGAEEGRGSRGRCSCPRTCARGCRERASQSGGREAEGRERRATRRASG
jgi:kinesin family protein C2/C3